MSSINLNEVAEILQTSFCSNVLRPMITSKNLNKSANIFSDVKMRFLGRKFCILFEISSNFVTKCTMNNNSAMVQVMVYCQICDKPLPEPALPLIYDAF